MFLHLGLHLLSHAVGGVVRSAASDNDNDEAEPDIVNARLGSTQQPYSIQDVQVPREFVMNVNEAHRCADNVTDYDRVILLHPRGELVTYTRYPTTITCQYCQSKVITAVEEQFDRLGVCLLITLLILFFPFGLCLLYYKSNYDSYFHTCPHCKKEVGFCN